MKLTLEILKRFYFISHAILLGYQGKQFLLQLCIEFIVNILNDKVNFFSLFIFGFGDFLNSALDLSHIKVEFLESFPESSSLFFDCFHMAFVDLTQPFELVLFVTFSEHGAVAANRGLAGVAVVV